MGHTDTYATTFTIGELITYNFIWGLAGIILGVVLNNLYKKLSIRMNSQVAILGQLILCSVVLALIDKQYTYFGWSWQNITAGLLFVSFFFGTQYHMFNLLSNF